MSTLRPPFPSPTKAWHNTSYPGIDPSRPELSAKGRAILITGGGTGIGAAVAHGFAVAGSRQIALLGRTQQTLSETADALKKEFKDINVTTQIADVGKADSVDAAFAAVVKLFGKIDVCVSNAAAAFPNSPTAESDPAEWRRSFESNVLGALHVAQAFLRTAKEGFHLIHTSSGISHLVPGFPGAGGYAATKAAANKIFEWIALENPGIFAVNVQPGVIDTKLSREGGGGMSVDDVNLPGDFYVWLASPEASFLNGKFAWTNWDVDELKARKEEIEKTDLFNTGVIGISTVGWNTSDVMPHIRS